MIFISNENIKKELSIELPLNKVASSSVGSVGSVSEKDNIIKNIDCQSVDPGLTETLEITKKFQPKKELSIYLKDSYSRLGYDRKASRVFECGTFLEFAHEINNNEISKQGKLHNANFCKDRLCPMCSWRRSYKVFAQMSRVMDVIQSQYSFVFLTLTVVSVPGEQLSDTLDKMQAAWHNFVNNRKFKKSIKGYFKTLEITRNNNKKSKSYGLFHPHYHCILAVNNSYFTSKEYIKQSQWLKLWQVAYGDNNITQVDIRKICSKKQFNNGFNFSQALAKAVVEVSKYAVKGSDYIFIDDPDLTDSIIKILVPALAGRRLTSMGGVLKKIHQSLNLDDMETGDLIHLDDKINPELSYLICRYGWSSGVYKLTDSYILNSTEMEVG